MLLMRLLKLLDGERGVVTCRFQVARLPHQPHIKNARHVLVALVRLAKAALLVPQRCRAKRWHGRSGLIYRSARKIVMLTHRRYSTIGLLLYAILPAEGV